MMRPLATLLLLLLIQLPLFGQKQYTLEECYQLALKNNIAVKSAQNEINISVLDRKTAQYSLLPSLSYFINHNFSYGKNIDPVTNDVVFDRFNGGSTGLDLQLELFSGFRRLHAIKQSAYSIQASGYAKERAELDVLSNITLSYARLLLDKEQASVSRNNIETTNKMLEVINEKIKYGRLTKYEYYAFNARLDSEKATLITIQNDSSIAMQELKQLLNMSYKDDFNVAPIDTSEFATIYASSISDTELIEAVLQTHPAIKQAQMNEKVAQLGVKMAKSSLLPSLSAGGNIDSNYSGNEVVADGGGKIPLAQQLGNNLGQNIYISLAIPIFSKKEFTNGVKREKINVSTTQLATQEAKNAVISSTLQLINEFNAAKQKYEATLSARKQNDLLYSLYAEKYKLGQISSVELLTAQDILNASTATFLQSKLELFFRYQLLMLLKNH